MNNNRHTRVNAIRSNIDNFKFAIAIGHGQHNPALPPALVPRDMYVIFMTSPGYLGHGQNTTSTKFQDLFSNKNKVRQFIKGNLPRNQLPSLITNKSWEWQKHIYPPNSIIANHELELFDQNIPTYDALTGIWLLSNPSVRYSHGTTVNLQDILNYVRGRETGKVIVFISGCRGDPAISQQSLDAAMALNERGYARLIGPQTYNVPLTNYLRIIRNFENQASRFMRLKRAAGSNSNSNKRVKREGASSGSNSNNNNRGTSLNLSLNVNSGSLTVLNKYKKMIERIQTPTFGVIGNKQLQIQAARKYFPNFFTRNMTNENVRLWVNTIKRNNTNLSNRLTILWKSEPVEQNWKNNRNVARRILYKIKNIQNRTNTVARPVANRATRQTVTRKSAVPPRTKYQQNLYTRELRQYGLRLANTRDKMRRAPKYTGNNNNLSVPNNNK